MGQTTRTKVVEKKARSSYHREVSKAKKVQHEFRPLTRDQLREKITATMSSCQDYTQPERSWEQCVYEGDHVADALFDDKELCTEMCKNLFADEDA